MTCQTLSLMVARRQVQVPCYFRESTELDDDHGIVGNAVLCVVFLCVPLLFMVGEASAITVQFIKMIE